MKEVGREFLETALCEDVELGGAVPRPRGRAETGAQAPDTVPVLCPEHNRFRWRLIH